MQDNGMRLHNVPPLVIGHVETMCTTASNKSCRGLDSTSTTREILHMRGSSQCSCVSLHQGSKQEGQRDSDRHPQQMTQNVQPNVPGRFVV